MRKSYFLTYGIIKHSVDEFAQVMNSAFNINFICCENSFYLLGGVFYNAIITIQNNFIEGSFNDWAEFEDQEFSVIMCIGNTTASNKDKAAIHKYFKQQLQQLDYVTLLEESIIEQAN